MSKTLGIIEFSSISKGIECADKMIKSAVVEVLILRHICPGKFLVIFAGDTENIKEALKDAEKDMNKIVETGIILNAHKDLIYSLSKRAKIDDIESIGIFETSTVTSALLSLDNALKKSDVKLVKLILGNGIGGKSYYVISGNISSVEEAVKASYNSINPKKLIYKTIIAHPDKDIINNI